MTPSDIPPTAIERYSALGASEKTAFQHYFNSNKRSMPLMMALAILFPIQLLFLGKVVLGIIFLITGGGFGVWYVIEWFLTPGRVRDYNAGVAESAFQVAAGAGAGTEEE